MRYIALFMTAWLSLFASTAHAATTVVSEINAVNLANQLVLNAPVGNITLVGAPAVVTSIGQTALVNNFNFGFVNGVALNMPGPGIMLTNGNMLGVSNNLLMPGDPNVETALGMFPGTSSDASSLTFSFTVQAGLSYVQLNAIFATNEQVGNTTFRDGAVIMVDGVNQGKFSNGDPLSNINTTSISATASNIITGYANVSSLQIINAPLNPALTIHTITIAIADFPDGLRDSAVLLAGLQSILPPPPPPPSTGGGGTGVTITLGNAPVAVPAAGSPDLIPPRMRLVGNPNVDLIQGNLYLDSGAIAVDNVSGLLTGAIITTNPVNPNIPGIYTVQYNVSDFKGNASLPLTRTVTIHATPLPGVDVLPPVVTPPADVVVNATDYRGISQIDPSLAAFFANAIAIDNVGVVGIVNSNAPLFLPIGRTKVTFTASDLAGNIGTAQAFVTVIGDASKMLPLSTAVDSDRDKLPDSWERANFVKLTVVGAVPDSDLDGIPDYWEVFYFGDLLTASLLTDFDIDGLSDALEWQMGTNPTLPNTNPNGYSTDSWSVIFSNNPSDTDDDGVIDALENRTTALTQSKVSGLPVAINSPVRYSIDAGANTLESVNTNLPAAGALYNTLSTFGVASFGVRTGVNGGGATVRLVSSSAFPAAAQFYSVSAAGAYRLIPGASYNRIAAGSVDITLIDGGPFDTDGIANGVIVYRIAVGSPAQVLGGSGSGGGGCAMMQTRSFDPLLPVMLLLSLLYLMRGRWRFEQADRR